MEEPPEKVIFILITPSPFSLPYTIISRSQIIRFSYLSFQIVDNIWRKKIDTQEKLPVYDGTLSFIDTLPLRDFLFEIFHSISEDDKWRYIFDILEKNKEIKANPYDILKIWFSFLKDMVFFCEDYIVNRNKLKYYKKMNRSFYYKSMLPFLDMYSKLIDGIERNISFSLWWEYLIIKTYKILYGGTSG